MKVYLGVKCLRGISLTILRPISVSFVNLVPGGKKQYGNDEQKMGGLSTEKKAEFERQS